MVHKVHNLGNNRYKMFNDLKKPLIQNKFPFCTIGVNLYYCFIVSIASWTLNRGLPSLGVELSIDQGIEVAMHDAVFSHQPSQREQIVVSNCLDLHLKRPDSGRLQYKSRDLKQTI